MGLVAQEGSAAAELVVAVMVPPPVIWAILDIEVLVLSSP